jgi:predicted transcriptional regulator
MEKDTSKAVIKATGAIVGGYLSGNRVKEAEIPAIIAKVYKSLSEQIGETSSGGKVPAVAVKDSVKDDYIICLEDGKKLKMLKRYIKTRYKLTEDQYRAKWGLGADYPMVAPNYAKARSTLAKKLGFGKK